MVSSKATTVEQYLKELPEDRRKEISTVRKVILKNLPRGFIEGMSHGMIAYYIPLEDFSDTYNGEPLGLAGIAAQRNYNSLYLMTVYGDTKIEKWFKERYKASGKKLDMGKSCVHFKKAEDMPLDLIAETIAKVPKDAYIKYVEDVRGSARLTRRR